MTYRLPIALIGAACLLGSCRNTPVYLQIIEPREHPELASVTRPAELEQWLTRHGNALQQVNIRLTDAQNRILYEHPAIDGYTNIERKSPGQWRLLEYWLLEIPDSATVCEWPLQAYRLNSRSGEITAEPGYPMPVRLNEAQSNNLLARLDSLVHRESDYASPRPWEVIPETEFRALRQLAGGLALAAMSGCDSCRTALLQLRTRLPHANAGETSEALQTCERLVDRTEQIRTGGPFRIRR